MLWSPKALDFIFINFLFFILIMFKCLMGKAVFSLNFFHYFVDKLLMLDILVIADKLVMVLAL